MSRKSRYSYLLEKSINAVISAIEIYNKPDFKYREESFSILMVNAWETLLKAKILCDNRNNLKSIYVEDKSVKRKDGKPYRNKKFKTNRTGNYMTIDLFSALTNVQLPKRLAENIELLVEIRDNAIHFYNDSKLFEKKVLEIGTATLKSYVHCVNDWFSYDLTQYNFYLMPISFFHSYEMESFSIAKEDEQHKNLLRHIEKKEKDYPSEVRKKHNISLILETKFVKSKSFESLSVRYDKNDPNAITVNVTAEEQFANKYKWGFRDDLVPKLKETYPDIRFDNNFRKIMRKIETDDNLCGRRYLDIRTKKGTPRKFYSPNILKVFDKYYNRKKK